MPCRSSISGQRLFQAHPSPQADSTPQAVQVAQKHGQVSAITWNFSKVLGNLTWALAKLYEGQANFSNLPHNFQVLAVQLGDPDAADHGVLAERALAGLHLVRHRRQRAAGLHRSSGSSIPRSEAS